MKFQIGEDKKYLEVQNAYRMSERKRAKTNNWLKKKKPKKI